MLHVPIAASGEGVHTPTKLPRHLRTRDPSASAATPGPGQGGERQLGSSQVGQDRPSGGPTQATSACPCRELWDLQALGPQWLQQHSPTPTPPRRAAQLPRLKALEPRPRQGPVQPGPLGTRDPHRSDPPTQVCTCSLVVRPRVTSTTWKPVRPMTGMKKRPATHMTAMLAR